ncbi:hypothetical protein SAY86_015814 [Trapa natans]|uniref:RRM domain-containing protein n=1 Tax=Trapa natans TaxID=22666 RepID=A0AAN7QWK1_TRANT|nr:hypothetical protein SAY86_015814 [Trapa natans]
MDEGDGAYGEGGDQVDHFHRNDVISAVADEGFLIDEDDDYEDLYNDVNVGENFLQSMRKNEDASFRNRRVEETKNEPPPPPPPLPPPPPPAVAAHAPLTGVVGEGNVGGVSFYQNQGFKEDEVKLSSGSGPPVAGGSGWMRIELAPQQPNKVSETEKLSVNTSTPNGPQGFVQQPNGVVGVNLNPGNVGPLGGMGNDNLPTQSGIRNTNPACGNGVVNPGGTNAVAASSSGAGNGGGGTTMLFVGDLHWWTTDAELEAELCKYGQVKEVKFFDEKASGKSKGYCQVEFFNPVSATACKEGMNGYFFNGKACVVAFASPASIRRMGEAQMNRNQQTSQSAVSGQGRRGLNDTGPKTAGNNIPSAGNFQGGDNNRGFGRGNWGRGNAQGMGNRGAVGPMRNRGAGMGGRDLMGNGFGQGMGGGPPMMHPQSMMGQGFDPAFGGPMGRLGGYGGFPGAPGPPYSGLLPTFPPVGGVGLPGVAPHVNPAIFGRMPMSGMGMLPGSGMEGPNVGMWSGNIMGGWGVDDHGGGRAGESSYGEEAASDHQYGEGAHDRGGWPNSSKEKDRVGERDWSGSSDRRYPDDREMANERDSPREKEMGHDRGRSEMRHRDDRDSGRERERDNDRDRERSRDRDRGRERDHDRDRGRDRVREQERERDRERHRDEKDRYSDHHRYRESERGDDYEKGRSSRTLSKSRLSQEDEHRSRSRDVDYGKRRRLTSE